MKRQHKTEYLFKVLVIGDASTGKTSFIKRYVHQFFSRAYKATLGIDFALKTLDYDEKTQVKLQLWDIAGQERFASMTRAYYKDAAGALVVFDATRPATFESVLRWKADLDSKVSTSDGANIPCLLVANKCDLVQRREADDKLLQDFARQNGFIGCVYASPKENVNIDEAANRLVAEIVKAHRSAASQDDDDDDDSLEEELRQRRETIVMSDRYEHPESQAATKTASCWCR